MAGNISFREFSYETLFINSGSFDFRVDIANREESELTKPTGVTALLRATDRLPGILLRHYRNCEW